MASAILTPVSEYLATSYRPDRDYLEGVLQERNSGEQPHALIQGILSAIFYENRHRWSVRVLPEQRVQITPNRFRILDLCILRRTDSRDPIVRSAPLLCIEILSSRDSLSELQERVNDYASLGTEYIWAIDPGNSEPGMPPPAGSSSPPTAPSGSPEHPCQSPWRPCSPN